MICFFDLILLPYAIDVILTCARIFDWNPHIACDVSACPYVHAKGAFLMLETGQQAPDFSLNTDTSSFRLADYRGKNVVVFFFPKADTSGCTKEAMAFSNLQAEFDAANTIVIGISKDDAKKHAKFREKHALSCLLGADVDGAVCEAFGVWVEKSMYGRKYMGIQRATFLIGPDGALTHIWPKVKVPGHAEDVLECLRAGG